MEEWDDILENRCRQATWEAIIVVQTLVDSEFDKSDAGGRSEKRNISRDIQHDSN